MSQLCGYNDVYNDVKVASVTLNLVGHFSPIISPFADRGISRRLTWSASGDERENKKSGVSTISLIHTARFRRLHGQKKKHVSHLSCLRTLIELLQQKQWMFVYNRTALQEQ
jgi:hypothetical protein